MFQDAPIFSIFSLAIAAYLFYMWYGDFRHFNKTAELRKGAFEGASNAPTKLIVLGIASALILLLCVTFIEKIVGVEASQTKVAPWALLSWIAAAFVEELIFRGYLVVKNKGNLVLWCSIIFFSFVFAAGHPFLWDYQIPENSSIYEGVWTLNLTSQALISTLAIFSCSILFYSLRFARSNVNRSILPCILAHVSYNCGVFVVKMIQGFLEW